MFKRQNYLNFVILQFFQYKFVRSILMYTIVEASEKHSADLTEFQLKMAMETEHLQLDGKLVREAIDYLASHKQYGQFYVAEEAQRQETCGSLLATYENQRQWWIQSVYVKPEHRRRGNFTNLFTNLVKKAQQKNVKSIKLYAETENLKAKQTYKKLGMYCNGELFYGIDLVYGKGQEKQKIKAPYFEGISVQKCDKIPEQHTLQFIFGKKSQRNQGLVCLKQGKFSGYCEYFQQFSEWRFGITFYIKFLHLDQKYSKQILNGFKKYLFENCTLGVGAIRYIVTQEQYGKMKEIDPNLHLQAYDVMAIDL